MTKKNAATFRHTPSMCPRCAYHMDASTWMAGKERLAT